MSQPYVPEPGTPGYPMAPNDETIQVNNAGDGYRDNAYVENQHASYIDQAGNHVEQNVEVFEDKNLQRENMRYWIKTTIYFILGVLEVIMGLRFIFRLLGANQGNGFISFLYNLSHPFVMPFNGIFNDQAIGSASVFELSTIIAMLIYALIAWGLVKLGQVIYSPTYNAQQEVVSTHRR
jgi:uncharacterized protein YggT (Ycf19 family)